MFAGDRTRLVLAALTAAFCFLAVAFAVDLTERERVRQRLARAGVSIEEESEHTIYFRDPEGRRVGVSSYPLPSVTGAADNEV